MMRETCFALTLGLLVLTGCASSPKSELRDLFSDVRDERFDAAEGRFRRLSSGRFSTYNDQVLEATDQGSGASVRWYLDNATAYIHGCRSLIDRVDSIRPQPDWDDDRIQSSKIEVESISSDFESICLLRNDKTGRDDFIEALTKVSSVDLSKVRPRFESAFQEKKLKTLAGLDSSEQRSEADRQAADNKQRELEETPKYFEQKMCELADLISQARRKIAQEREVGKTSGVVNALVLHRNGQRVQTFESQLNSVKQRYREKFGKPWSGGGCD